MTVVLISVYVPIAFQGGLTGALFTEFAFTLVGTVTISAVVALTLSPMMSSRLLTRPGAARGWQQWFGNIIDRRFEDMRNFYLRRLHNSLDYLPVTAVFALLVLSSIYFLYTSAKSELAPQEDQESRDRFIDAGLDATLQQKVLYAKQVYQIMKEYPETDHVFQINAPGRVVAGMVLKPWDERSRTSNQLQPIVQQRLNEVAGPGSRRFNCLRCRAARVCRCNS